MKLEHNLALPLSLHLAPAANRESLFSAGPRAVYPGKARRGRTGAVKLETTVAMASAAGLASGIRDAAPNPQTVPPILPTCLPSLGWPGKLRARAVEYWVPSEVGELPHEPRCVVYWVRSTARTAHNWALHAAMREAEATRLPLLVIALVSTNEAATVNAVMQFLAVVADRWRVPTLAMMVPPKVDDHVGLLLQLLTAFAPLYVFTDVPLAGPADPLLEAVAAQLAANGSAPLFGFESDACLPHTALPRARVVPKAELGAALEVKQRVWVSDTLSMGDKVHPALPAQIAAPLFQYGSDSELFLPTALMNDPRFAACRRLAAIEPRAGADVDAEAKRVLGLDLGRLFLQATTAPVIPLLADVRHGALSGPSVVVACIRAGCSMATRHALMDAFVVDREAMARMAAYAPLDGGYLSLPAWIRDSLEAHADDTRDAEYTVSDLRELRVHDRLWLSIQAVFTRLKVIPHPVLRGYWASRFLRWFASPSEAFAAAMELYAVTRGMPALDALSVVEVASPGFGLGTQPGAAEVPVFGRVIEVDASVVRATLQIDSLQPYLVHS
ncbi:deoxyribodipyrimidine photo-lyase type II [Thecamonas trahens ATCC 50062]|uniref:Deoxyribodipyrimidine photo-lyase type II n=1 Tax=Thecamonas trahens ATCC 50062 TaxID=461836 RepID=A0A0L0D3T7_THETB|nr:deoxyribodipyrimidine photo-lyase type II [Thecamonas trahens ATCC 50062]KNC47012.1 deoxyribodipyrimidine photo-lyase type II [Thecamonas trahens ATCC 50062]|eukprot:XP_013759792.1 deoxyribodipyrimidine photo-lyase type II [Thecamonas trahens ATCC 50062]